MSDQSPITVSVITPSFNHAHYLDATIESVLSQSWPGVEHIIVDGGSTDGTVPLLQRYSARYPGRVRWVSEPDTGQSQAFNKGLAMARGDYIGWQNSDDYYLPQAFKRLVACLAANPALGAVYGDCVMIDATAGTRTIWHGRRFSLQALLRDNYIPNQAAMLRRSALVAVGGLREDLHYTMDYDLWLRLGTRTALEYLPGPAGVFRVHADAKTWAGWVSNRMEVAYLLQTLGADPHVEAAFAREAQRMAAARAAEALATSLRLRQPTESALLLETVARAFPAVFVGTTLFDQLLRDALRVLGCSTTGAQRPTSLRALVSLLQEGQQVPLPRGARLTATQRLLAMIDASRRQRYAAVAAATLTDPGLFRLQAAWGMALYALGGAEAARTLRAWRLAVARRLSGVLPAGAQPVARADQEQVPASQRDDALRAAPEWQ